MVAWFTHNWGTLAAAAAVLAVAALAAIKLIRDKRKGTCACGCAHCPNRGACHRS